MISGIAVKVSVVRGVLGLHVDLPLAPSTGGLSWIRPATSIPPLDYHSGPALSMVTGHINIADTSKMYLSRFGTHSSVMHIESLVYIPRIYDRDEFG